MGKRKKDLYDKALAIIDDNLDVEHGIIANRFATASLIVKLVTDTLFEFAKELDEEEGTTGKE